MTIQDAEGMAAEATRFVMALKPRAEGATLVTLSGELGAGKTAFVKAAAKKLGVDERVTSPTFVIMKIYELEGAGFSRLVHIDAYRLKGAHHLKVLGWDSLLADPQNLIFMEWPEQVPEAIPTSAIRITLRYSEGDGREIDYHSELQNSDAEAVSAA